MKSLNHNNYVHKPRANVSRQSNTVPDQSLTIPEILARFAKGLSVGGGRSVTYDEDDEMPDVRTLDLTDIHDLAEEARDGVAAYKKKTEADARKKEQDDLKKKFRAEYDAEKLNSNTVETPVETKSQK